MPTILNAYGFWMPTVSECLRFWMPTILNAYDSECLQFWMPTVYQQIDYDIKKDSVIRIYFKNVITIYVHI